MKKKKTCLAKCRLDKQFRVYNRDAVSVAKWSNAILVEDRVNLPHNRPSFLSLDVDLHSNYSGATRVQFQHSL